MSQALEHQPRRRTADHRRRCLLRLPVAHGDNYPGLGNVDWRRGVRGVQQLEGHQRGTGQQQLFKPFGRAVQQRPPHAAGLPCRLRRHLLHSVGHHHHRAVGVLPLRQPGTGEPAQQRAPHRPGIVLRLQEALGHSPACRAVGDRAVGVQRVWLAAPSDPPRLFRGAGRRGVQLLRGYGRYLRGGGKQPLQVGRRRAAHSRRHARGGFSGRQRGQLPTAVDGRLDRLAGVLRQQQAALSDPSREPFASGKQPLRVLRRSGGNTRRPCQRLAQLARRSAAEP